MTEEIKSKICPMRPPAYYDHNSGETSYFKCEENECAWWDFTRNCCAVTSIALTGNGWAGLNR